MSDTPEDSQLQAALDAADWVLDPVGATKYATTHSYQQGLPPHWHRCDYMRDGIRCAKGSGHEHKGGKAAEHEAPKP